MVTDDINEPTQEADKQHINDSHFNVTRVKQLRGVLFLFHQMKLYEQPAPVGVDLAAGTGRTDASGAASARPLIFPSRALVKKKKSLYATLILMAHLLV